MTMRREYRRMKVSAAESAELWERWKKGEGPCDWPGAGQRAYQYRRACEAKRRHQAASSATLDARFDDGGTRRDLKGHSCGSLCPSDRACA